MPGANAVFDSAESVLYFIKDHVLEDSMIEKNVGGLDRIARVGIGSILAVVGFSMLLVEGLPLVYGGVVLIVGLVLLTTAATQRCVLNQVLGVNTCKRPGAD